MTATERLVKAYVSLVKKGQIKIEQITPDKIKNLVVIALAEEE